MPGASVDHERREFTVSQSWLSDLQRCPERARRELVSPSFGHSSETAVGTALHLFMEWRLLGKPFDEATDLATTWMLDLVNAEATSDQRSLTCYVPYKPTMGKDTMQRHLDACIRGFDRHVVPQVPGGGHVETTMRAVLAQDDEDWVVVLEGRPDYVDPFDRVWDWKSAASEWNIRETSRWAIQPSAYTYLASQTFGTHVTEFTYAVAVKPHGVIQFIDVERKPADWQWLARIARGALGLARTMLYAEWPVNHDHYLCSEKWCPHWSECRGSYYDDNEGDTRE